MSVPAGAAAAAGQRPAKRLRGAGIGTPSEGRSCYWLDHSRCHDCQVARAQLRCLGGAAAGRGRAAGATGGGSGGGVGARCAESFCPECCAHYAYLLDLEEEDSLRGLADQFCAGACPCCLEICVCRACLHAEVELPAAPVLSRPQRRVLAMHLAWCLREPAAKLLAPRVEAAGRWGVAPDAIPLAAVPEGSRLLCNRCVVGIEDVFARCPKCGREFCPSCVKELQPAGGPAAGEPVCLRCIDAALELQTVLRPDVFARLRDADAALQRARSAGGAGVDGYDFANRLWRLPPPLEADAVDGGVPAPVPAAGLPPPPQQRQQQQQPPRQAPSLTPWHHGLPLEDYRLASDRPGGRQNYMWTPHVRDFAPDSPRRAETVARFVERWGAGEPIVVRGFRGGMSWGPSTMARAVCSPEGAEGGGTISVIDCADGSAVEPGDPAAFFALYELCSGDTRGAAGDDLRMLKIKDFPADDTFCDRCPRHNADFTRMLNTCMPEYMHPTGGALNLAGMLSAGAVPPDLGPKGYIACGREEEHAGGGDSVTPLHEDVSDAINILCHVQHRPDPGAAPPARGAAPPARCGDAPAAPPSYGGAGAVWDLFLREDLPVLRQFLQDALDGKIPGLPSFVHHGVDLASGEVPVLDVVHDQCFYLTAAHRAVLAEQYGVYSWHVEQYEWEGVLIPAVVAHQVRNVRSCIKTALDFVSPESVGECMKLREEIRRLAITETEAEAVAAEADVGDLHFQDKLQVGNMVFEALLRALGGLATPREVRTAAAAKVVDILEMMMPREWAASEAIRMRIAGRVVDARVGQPGVEEEAEVEAAVQRVAAQVMREEEEATLRGGGGGGAHG